MPPIRQTCAEALNDAQTGLREAQVRAAESEFPDDFRKEIRDAKKAIESAINREGCL